MTWVRGAVRTELRMYGGLGRLLSRRTDVPEGTTPIRYVGAASLLLWVITGVSTVEVVVLDLILPWTVVRIVAAVLGIWGVVWCLGMTGCHYVYPHLAADDGLRLRAAAREPVVVIPWEQIASVAYAEASRERSRAVQVEDGTAHLVVTSRTNVAVTLREPLTVRGEEVTTVRFMADHPRDVVKLVRDRVGGARHPQ